MSLSTLKKGDNWKFTFTVLDPQGSPIDITGGSIWLTFKDKANLGQPDSNASFQISDLDIQQADDAENNVTQGVVVLRAAPGDSVGPPPTNTKISAAKYDYDAQYKHTDGVITTIDSGTVTVSQQVTEAE